MARTLSNWSSLVPMVSMPATPAVRARASTRRGRTAVYAALRKELRRKHITKASYRRWSRTYVRSVRTLRRLSGAIVTSVQSTKPTTTKPMTRPMGIEIRSAANAMSAPTETTAVQE